MAAVFFEFVGQIYDADGLEGAFFDADAASAAKALDNYSLVSFNPYGFHSTAHHGAEANAELIAFFDFAFILIKYGNSRHD